MEGFVVQDGLDLSSILSPEALAALQGLAVERGVMKSSDDEDLEIDAKALVGGLAKHFQQVKIGEKEQIFNISYGGISFDVKGVKKNLGQTLDSTGLTIWRAAEHLCEYLIDNKIIISNKHVCELGGGLGMVSILIHKLNVAKSVVCTDGDDVSLKLLNENNDSTGCADGENGMKVAKLYWGEHDDFLKEHPLIDTIVAADVVYEEEQIQPLLSTTVAILEQAAANKINTNTDSDNVVVPQLILAYARRNVPIDRVFDCATRLGLNYEMLDGDIEPIVRFTLASPPSSSLSNSKEEVINTVFNK
jgi:hypothetical protein